MASRKVRAEELVDEIAKILQSYNNQVTENVRKAEKTVAEDTVKLLKTTGDYEDRRGKYRKSFAIKENGGKGRAGVIVHSKAPHHRLTHLLEHGHATVDGGRTRAFPHWKPAEEAAIAEFEKEVEEAIEEAGKK